MFGEMLTLLAWLLALTLPFVLLVAIRGVRDAVDRQTETLEAIGRAAGWLPPRRQK